MEKSYYKFKETYKFQIQILIGIFLLNILSFQWSFAQSVTFNDSGADTMIVGNAYYEMGLSKRDGHIDYIKDVTTGKDVSIGNEYGSLWRVAFLNGSEIYSINYGGGQTNQFSYHWYSSGDSLVFNYTPDISTTPNVPVTTTITFSSGHHFDMSIRLKNNASDTLLSVIFPRMLMFNVAGMRSAYIPIIPGVKLNQGFFADHKDWNNGNYPGSMNFADYIHLETTGGDLAVYHILREDFTPYVIRRLYFDHDNDTNQDVYVLFHSFLPDLPPGESWESPILRYRVGQDVYTTAEDYRKDFGLDTTPSLKDKLGRDYLKTVSALSSKIDVGGEYFGSNLTLPDYKNYLPKIPRPSLLLFVGWPQGGYDKVAPDLFPPDPRWGTNQDLTEIANEARKLGDIMNPYINPTYWNEGAPTFNTLNVQDVAVLDHNRVPDHESYCPTCIGGYGMSPYNSSVITRLQEEMDQVNKYLSPKTLWVDQIGSRAGLDYNPSEPRIYGQAQGWLNYARKYKNMHIIDEFGYDRMVAPLVGFQGTMDEFLINGDTEIGDGAWGKGNWEYFPLIPFLVRDKVMLLNAPDNRCISKDTLSWSFAMGYSLSFVDPFHNIDNDWLWNDASFQKNVVALYADERVSDYSHATDSVTVTSFQNYKVLTNWAKLQNYQQGGDVISPSGFEVTGNAGHFKAGIFQKFNNHALASGDNYIIYHQYTDSIVVRYTMGPGTELWSSIPSTWGTSPDVRAYAIAYDSSITAIPVQIQNNEAGIQVSVKMNNRRINKYVVTNGPLYLTNPVLAFPVEGKNIPSDSLNFSWDKVDGATAYEMQISKDPSFERVLYDYQNITDTTTAIKDSLDSGSTFYWRTRGTTTAKLGPWSGISEFRVIGTNLEDGLIAYYPFQGNANDASKFRNNGTVHGGVTLASDSLGNANSAYDFDGTDGYIQIPESSSYMSAKQQVTVAAWVYPRTYKDEVGVAVHENFWRLLLSQGNVTGNVFNAQWQENRVLSNQQVPLNAWSHIAFTYDGDSIRVYINGRKLNELSFPSSRIGSSAASAPVTIGHGIGNSQNFFDGKMDNVVVYNRALSDTEISVLAHTFYILLPPRLESPADQQEGVQNATSLTWDKQSGAASYRVEVSLDNHFTKPLLMDTTVTDTAVSLPALKSQTTYYWRVESKSTSDISNWSIYNSFSTNVPLAIESNKQVPAKFMLNQNYPNPFNPTTRITYQLKSAVTVHLTVYDIIGRRVADLVDERQNAGLHAVTFNALNLASGLYFYRLQAGSFVAVKKMILLK